MDEITRQEYLSSMGIQSYFPRYVLPAAKSSKQCEWPEKLSEDTSEKLSDEPKINIEFKQAIESQPASTSRPKEDHAAITKTLTEVEKVEKVVKVVKEEKGEKEEKEEKVEKPETNTAIEEVRFQLAIIYVNTDTLVLISRPYMQASNSLSAVQQQLFSNIFNALYQGPVSLNSDIKPFLWPFSEASHMEKDGQAAKASLGAYLEQLKTKHSFTRLILMGEKIAQFVEASDKHELTVCRSLDEMLKMPKFKREVWLQLKTKL